MRLPVDSWNVPSPLPKVSHRKRVVHLDLDAEACTQMSKGHEGTENSEHVDV